MRIISGRLGGRTLPARVPPGTRPTSDRVREALFAMLDARGVVLGARVLDLFAGTGALGLEALSRGAKSVTAVERDPRALSVVRKNAATLGLSESVRCVRGDVASLTLAAAGTPADGFDLVLLDPPYAQLALASHWLSRAGRSPWLGRGAVVSVEMSAKDHLPAPANLIELRRARYGDSAIVLFSPMT